MPSSTFQQRQALRQLDRPALRQYQLERLNKLLEQILPTNRFYRDKLASVRFPLRSLGELTDWPFTYKEELLADAEGANLANNLTFPIDEYCRFHQTSGTRGRPIVVLDTAADWQWFSEGWQYVLDAAEVTSTDRAMMAFSFGPFIAFWSAHEALSARGCMIVTGGGMKTLPRLELMRTSGANLLFCTPSYALHLAEVAIAHQIEVRELGVRCLVLAGEPGASVPSIRSRIENTWDARVLDHSGATEVGPWGCGDRAGRGIYVTESEFIAEFLALGTGEPAVEGEVAELVLTNLGRVGCPVIRYRTGDLVRPIWSAEGESRFVMLERGVLSRADDMVIVRGVNIFPSSIDQILRSFPEIVEYRTTATRVAQMDQLEIEIEDRLNQPSRVANELQLRLGLRIDVRCVPIGALPRFESKGKRFVDRRTAFS